jgi:hypothetical protein
VSLSREAGRNPLLCIDSVPRSPIRLSPILNRQQISHLPSFPSLPAAGADIKEMKDKTLAESYKENYLASWAKITDFTKPVIGAVNGYAVRVVASPDRLLDTN